MPLAIQFTIRKKGLENFRKSDMQKAGRAGMKLAGDLVHKLCKPRKFGPSAQQRYKLRFRDPKYRLRKRKRQTIGGPKGGFARAIGEDKPFVFSGVTRRLAMAGNKVIARAPTADRHFADVIINAPALNYKSWVREEFERLNKDELKELQKAATKRYERELTKNGKQIVRKTKK